MVLLGDAKWRIAAEGQVIREDAFQIVSYLTHAQIRTGFLCYPAARQLPTLLDSESYLVTNSQHLIVVMRIDAEKLCSGRQTDVSATATGLSSALSSYVGMKFVNSHL
jgi:5-methylcytosine-specific restriction endonuclease McrBC regulatory subunit McrC